MNKILKEVAIILSLFSLIDASFASERVRNSDNLKGHQVKWDYENNPMEREIAHRYFLENYKDNQVFHGIKIEDVGIDLYDLDDDGEKEIIAYVNYGDRCPRAGCPFATLKVLPKSGNGGGGGYKVSGWVMESKSCLAIYDPPPVILNTTTLGYHDVLFKLDDGEASIWKWDGRRYDW